MENHIYKSCVRCGRKIGSKTIYQKDSCEYCFDDIEILDFDPI